jgi:hypothetical protein
MLIVGLITGILLYLIGSAMESSERAKQDREWEEVLRKRRERHAEEARRRRVSS